MALVAVVLILIIWAGIGIKESFSPQNPPIGDMDEHLKVIQSLPNQKARQKYLKQMTKHK
jgi:hypothetical protein